MKIVETYIIKCFRVTECIEQCCDNKLEEINNNTGCTEKQIENLLEENGFIIGENGFISGNIKLGHELNK